MLATCAQQCCAMLRSSVVGVLPAPYKEFTVYHKLKHTRPPSSISKTVNKCLTFLFTSSMHRLSEQLIQVDAPIRCQL